MKLIIYIILPFILCFCSDAEFCVTEECASDFQRGLGDVTEPDAPPENGNSDGEQQIVQLPDEVEALTDFEDPTGDGATEAFRITNVTFEFGSSEIAPEFEDILEELSLYLLSKNFSKLVVYGHTDSIGSEESNLVLSQDRALSVKDYLRGLDYLSGLQIDDYGLGETQPIDSNDTDSGRQKNRRVEFFAIP